MNGTPDWYISEIDIITVYYRSELEGNINFVQQINDSIVFYNGGKSIEFCNCTEDGLVFNFNGGSCNYILFLETPTNQICSKEDNID